MKQQIRFECHCSILLCAHLESFWAVNYQEVFVAVLAGNSGGPYTQLPPSMQLLCCSTRWRVLCGGSVAVFTSWTLDMMDFLYWPVSCLQEASHCVVSQAAAFFEFLTFKFLIFLVQNLFTSNIRELLLSQGRRAKGACGDVFSNPKSFYGIFKMNLKYFLSSTFFPGLMWVLNSPAVLYVL